tara:strand:- start:1940 stop:2365 length:426 start_codon:yes stop_codon:yes gene_type:complete
MSDQLQLEVVTPQRTIVDMLVDTIILPGIEGEMGILPNHVPLLTIMDSGILSYTLNKKFHSIAVHSGYAQVDGKSLRVLVELAELKDEIDLERAKSAEKKANIQLNSPQKNNEMNDDEKTRLKYELKLKRSLVRQRLALMV